jgi:hypothetical protein
MGATSGATEPRSSAAASRRRGLAELAPLRVNVVRAGAFRTPMWDGIPDPQGQALFTRLAERTLVGKVGSRSRSPRRIST